MKATAIKSCPTLKPVNRAHMPSLAAFPPRHGPAVANGAASKAIPLHRLLASLNDCPSLCCFRCPSLYCISIQYCLKHSCVIDRPCPPPDSQKSGTKARRRSCWSCFGKHRLRSTISRANQIRLFIGEGHGAVPSSVWQCFERELAAEPCLTDPPTPRQRAMLDAFSARRGAAQRGNEQNENAAACYHAGGIFYDG